MSGFSLSSEPFTLARDCGAVMVPQGESVTLPAGQVGYITQALGGSFTVYVEGNLFRIAGNDADAWARSRRRRWNWPMMPAMPMSRSWCGSSCAPCSIRRSRSTWSSWAWSTTCRLESSAPDQRKVYVKMTLTAPGCGMGDVLIDDARTKLELIPTVAEADVDLVFDPPWNHSMMSDAAKLETGML